MQKIVFFIMLIPLWASSQVDSTKSLSEGVLYMRNELRASHNEFSTGASIWFGGVALGCIGAGIHPTTLNDGSHDYGLKNAVLIGAGIISIVGAIIAIDSHKHIGRAGRWHLSAGGISLQLTK